MATRIIVGLALVLALVLAFAPDVDSSGMLSLALVVLGVAFAVVAVDAEHATDFLVLAVAAGAATSADVLGHIPAVGEQLDAIFDHVATVLYSGAITVLAVKVFNWIKG